jgi:hypothetical protein
MAPRDRKPTVSADRAGRKKPSPPLEELKAYSIGQFCQAHNISVDTYFRMQRHSHGPATMKVGQRTLISAEAAAAWRQAAQEQAVRTTRVKRKVKETATAWSQEMGAA